MQKSVQRHHITYFFLRSQFYKLLLFWRKKCLYTVQSSSFCPSGISVSVQSEVTSIQGLGLRIDSWGHINLPSLNNDLFCINEFSKQLIIPPVIAKVLCLPPSDDKRLQNGFPSFSPSVCWTFLEGSGSLSQRSIFVLSALQKSP